MKNEDMEERSRRHSGEIIGAGEDTKLCQGANRGEKQLGTPSRGVLNSPNINEP